MPDAECPEWVLAARKFVATRRPGFLEKAISTCPDETVRAFLKRDDLGQVPPPEFKPLVDRLSSDEDGAEAAVIEILAMHAVAYAADSPERFEDKETWKIVAAICNRLASLSREHGFDECEACFARTLGTGLSEQHRWNEARKLFLRAAAVYRVLADEEPSLYTPELAWTLNNLGNVLRNERDFPGARDAFEEGLVVYRGLAEKEPHIYLPDVAATLNNLGNVLSNERDFPGARDAFEQGLVVYRGLAEEKPHIYLPYVAATLNNLGTVLTDERDFPGARNAYEEGLAIRRRLAEKEPHIYLPDVAGTLNNLGNVLTDERDFPGARDAFEEGLRIRRALAEKEPHIYLPDVAATLNNLGTVLFEMDNEEGAIETSRKAVEAAEWEGFADDALWLAKGWASAAYARFLSHLAAERNIADAFRCLAAMREGHVRATGRSQEHGLERAGAALADVSRRTGRPVVVLVAQGLTRDGVLLGVLRAEKPHLTLARADDLGRIADELFAEIFTIFDDPDTRDPFERNSKIRALATDAWAALPKEIADVLHPENPCDILVSGDSYWTAFPWEILHFGEGDDDFLGLHRSLVRWGPLTAKAFDQLFRCDFGYGALTAAVVSPWNVPDCDKIPTAKQAALSVGKTLHEAGYKVEAAIADGANRDNVSRLLAEAPTVFHYAGHGTIHHNEELLLLWDRPLPEGNSYALFGRTNLSELKSRYGKTAKLFDNGPLVVLTACLTGRTRDFGGQREDLAWSFLHEGAQAVVATPLPTHGPLAKTIGALLYGSLAADEKGMAWSFLETRALAERDLRRRFPHIWPTWALMSYHGNPYAQLPRILEVSEAQALEAFAAELGIEDLVEAEALLGEIRSRL